MNENLYGAPAPLDNDDLSDESEFLIGFLRFNMRALWAYNHETAEAAYWLFRSGSSHVSGFPRICEALNTDPKIIRREVVREMHYRLLERMRAREPRWQKIADWYAEKEGGYFPLDWMVASSRIPKTRLQEEATIAMSASKELQLLSCSEFARAA